MPWSSVTISVTRLTSCRVYLEPGPRQVEGGLITRPLRITVPCRPPQRLRSWPSTWPLSSHLVGAAIRIGRVSSCEVDAMPAQHCAPHLPDRSSRYSRSRQAFGCRSEPYEGKGWLASSRPLTGCRPWQVDVNLWYWALRLRDHRPDLCPDDDGSRPPSVGFLAPCAILAGMPGDRVPCRRELALTAHGACHLRSADDAERMSSTDHQPRRGPTGRCDGRKGAFWFCCDSSLCAPHP